MGMGRSWSQLLGTEQADAGQLMIPMDHLTSSDGRAIFDLEQALATALSQPAPRFRLPPNRSIVCLAPGCLAASGEVGLGLDADGTQRPTATDKRKVSRPLRSEHAAPLPHELLRRLGAVSHACAAPDHDSTQPCSVRMLAEAGTTRSNSRDTDALPSWGWDGACPHAHAEHRRHLLASVKTQRLLAAHP